MRGVEREVSTMGRDDGGVNEGSTRGRAERSCVHAGLEEACGRRCGSHVYASEAGLTIEGVE